MATQVRASCAWRGNQTRCCAGAGLASSFSRDRAPPLGRAPPPSPVRGGLRARLQAASSSTVTELTAAIQGLVTSEMR